jgi:hypothetical protein
MRCEELRAAAGLGALDAEAEEHVGGCEACFSWLEGRDPLIQALRAARPPDVQPSPALAGEVVTAWRATALLPAPGRALLGLSFAAFAAAVCAVSIMALTALVGSRLGHLAGQLGGGLASLLAPASALAGFATGQLRDHPAWLLGLGLVAVLAGWAWTRIDVGLAAAMREAA